MCHFCCLVNLPRFTLLRAVGLLLAVVFTPSCGGKDEGHHGESSAEDIEEAGQLLTAMQANDYRTFDRAPGWENAHQAASTPHHGEFVDIYVNDVLGAALQSGAQAPGPGGSVVIKDGWSDAAGTQAFQISILRKDGTDSWFGAEYSASGEVLEAGRNFEECNGCHKSGADYVLAF